MVLRSRHGVSDDAIDLAVQSSGMSASSIAATLISLTALLVSGFNLWDASLKAPDIKVYVPRIIGYTSPYQNTNVEVFTIPVTLANEGARSGTVIGLDLAVTDPRTGKTKNFYAAETGVWSMERTRERAYAAFAPISLAGHSSHSEQIIFSTRGEKEQPDELVREVGPYEFKLTVTQAVDAANTHAKPITVVFKRSLPFYDARVFQTSTIPMNPEDWQAASN